MKQSSSGGVEMKKQRGCDVQAFHYFGTEHAVRNSFDVDYVLR